MCQLQLQHCVRREGCARQTSRGAPQPMRAAWLFSVPEGHCPSHVLHGIMQHSSTVQASGLSSMQVVNWS